MLVAVTLVADFRGRVKMLIIDRLAVASFVMNPPGLFVPLIHFNASCNILPPELADPISIFQPQLCDVSYEVHLNLWFNAALLDNEINHLSCEFAAFITLCLSASTPLKHVDPSCKSSGLTLLINQHTKYIKPHVTIARQLSLTHS